MAVAYLSVESSSSPAVAPPDPRRAPRSDSRERLLEAIGKVAAERGYAELSVERIARAAGVSVEEYHRHFDSEDQGLLAAFDAFVADLEREVAAACAVEPRWTLKVRAAVAVLVDALAESAALARVFAVEAVAGSLAFAERQTALLDRFAALLAEGRRVHPRGAGLPEMTERALVGGAASIVCKHLLHEDADELRALGPQLTEFLLIPFLDLAEARRVAAG